MGRLQTPEVRAKISATLKGRKKSEAMRSKLMLHHSKPESHLQILAKSRIGTKRPSFSKEWRKRIGDSTRGDKSGMWKGGITRRSDYKLIMNRKWRKENKEYSNFLARRRSYLKINALGSHSFEEWQSLKGQYNWTCPCCKRKEPEIKLTEDHIIPLSKGGTNDISNIQPLCVSCNSKKSTKIVKFDRTEKLEYNSFRQSSEKR